MKNIEFNKWQIPVLALLFLGLVVSLVLVQQQQLLEKKAGEDLYGAFDITDPAGAPLNCSGDTCQTNTLDVKIKVRDLERLVK